MLSGVEHEEVLCPRDQTANSQADLWKRGPSMPKDTFS